MTTAYANGVAIFGSTDLDGLASSSGLTAGWESAVITNTGDTHLLSGRFRANASTPTAGKLEVWVIPVWDIGGTPTYPDVFDGTSSVETVSYRNVLPQSGQCIKSFDTDGTTARYYEFAGVDLESVFGKCPHRYVVFITHSMVTALNATASNGGQCWYEQVTY